MGMGMGMENLQRPDELACVGVPSVQITGLRERLFEHELRAAFDELCGKGGALAKGADDGFACPRAIFVASEL
jgi:hypothetical protein